MTQPRPYIFGSLRPDAPGTGIRGQPGQHLGGFVPPGDPCHSQGLHPIQGPE